MKLTLVKKTEEAKGTKSFFWEPEKEVKWLPGQYFYYTLPNLGYPDARGQTRHFTISSSPTEGTRLRLTTRIREESGYKKTLDELDVGVEIEGEGPNGTFILDESEKGKNHIFLAGGIGITAFRSFISYNIDKRLEIPMFLIYSNSMPEEIAFRQELEDWAERYPYINILLTVSKPELSKERWKGKTGRIDEKVLLETVSNWGQKISDSEFWIVGPPPMVESVEKAVKAIKTPTRNIRTEKFTGY